MLKNSWITLIPLLLAFLSLEAQAAVTAAQRTAILKLETTATRATNLTKLGRYPEAAVALKDGYAEVTALLEKADADVVKAVTPHFERLQRVHASLELEGYELPAAPKLEAGATPATATPPGAKPATPLPGARPALPNGAVSFVNNVAPFLVSKCGRCHVSDTKGKFSAASYESLMKSGFVVPPGGVFLDSIESGDMPRGGGKVDPAELAMLKKWLSEGGKFDGPDPKANITSLAPGAKPAEPLKIEVAAATGKESILFSRDLAPVLVENCIGCHGDNNPRMNLSFSTFARLLKGGDSGPPLVPTRPADSLLVKKLLGTATGQRMPMGRPPLAADVIAKFEKWITEGARFDGPDQGMDLRTLALVAVAKASTHEQLAESRKIAALKNWRTGNPGEQMEQHETENFLVLGNLPEPTLAEFAKQSEAVAQKVAAQFKHPAGQPLIKGKMTLYLFKQRYDYAEFGQMVEKKPVPPGVTGHWNFSVVDAYTCLIAPRDDLNSAAAALGPDIACMYIASRSLAPRWFAEGAGRMAYARLDAKNPAIAAWQAEVPKAMGAIKKPDDFLAGTGPNASLAAFAFCQFLASSTPRYQALLGTISNGTDFTSTFAKNYGGTPEQVAGAWLSRGAMPRP